MNASLRADLIEHTDHVSENPAALLRRSGPSDNFPNVLVYEYQSDVVPGLRVRLYFQMPDENPRLLLVAIRDFIGPDDVPS